MKFMLLVSTDAAMLDALPDGELDGAMRIAAEFPWARTGCIEVRPVQDLSAVRRRVGVGTTH
jgi:hypothetical protein